MKQLLISVSGGRSSSVMAHIIATSEKYIDVEKLFVFANTGKEREETFQFLTELEQLINHKIHWVEAVVTMQKGVGIEAIEVNYKTASRNGEPFKAVIEKESLTAGFGKLPNMSSPYCSGRLKEVPIHKFAKEYFGTSFYTKAMGYRLEDIEKTRRISWAEVRKEINEGRLCFPLLTDLPEPLNQLAIHRYLKQVGVNLKIKSSRGNCDLCWKKSDKNLIETIREGNVDISFWLEMEKLTGDKFYRKKRSIQYFVDAAKQGTPLTLFNDIEEPCFCGM